MSILTADEVARHCHRAGFRSEALLTIVAIARAESGFDAAAVGDTTLVDETWGPSIGLLQVRSLHVDRGTGRIRDELANSDPAHNARAGWEISARGTRFTPWSVFTSGAYERHLADVWSACHAVDPTVPPLGEGRAVLRRGDTGPSVTALQRRLGLAGFPVDVDGEFGPQTEEAVRKFQATRGLATDGVVGPDTWRALPEEGTGRRPVLRRGDQGPEVAELQRRLTAAGFACTADGDFGPHTEWAVSEFQASRGLTVDGRVGPETWSALDRVRIAAPVG